MPREISHGFIAIKALEKTQRMGSKILGSKDLLAAFLIGTATPDSGYYCKSPFHNGDEISDVLHASDQRNSYHLANKLIVRSSNSNGDNLHAFSIGYLSHLFLDSLWHPFIFHSTGDYYDPDPIERGMARARHRRLETLIDGLLLSSFDIKPEKFHLKKNLTYLSGNLESIARALSETSATKAQSIIASWRWHSQLQMIFFSPSLSAQINRLPLKLEFRALFNALTKDDLNLTTNLIEESSAISFAAWLENSILELTKLFQALESDYESFFESTIGASPNSGKIGQHHYEGPYDPKTWLTHGY